MHAGVGRAGGLRERQIGEAGQVAGSLVVVASESDDGLEVLGGGFGGEVGVALSNGVEQGAVMVPGVWARRLVLGEGGDGGPERFVELIEQLAQQGVSGQVYDSAVESEVGVDECRGVVADEAVSLVEDGGQFPYSVGVGGHPRGGEAGSFDLEPAAHFEDLDDVCPAEHVADGDVAGARGFGWRAGKGAGAVRDHDQPIATQSLDCLPDRGAPHTELGGQGGFARQSFTSRPPSGVEFGP